jgi:uncharacterized protein YkwD
MCQINSTPGITASGPPGIGKAPAVGSANGAPPKVGSENGGPDAKGAGPEGAVAGANSLGGGGTGLAGALEALKAAVAALGEVIAKLGSATGGGGGCGAEQKGVLGVQGTEATTQQYVARTATTTSSGDKEDHAFEQRVLELINVERAKYGLSPVRYNGALDNASEKHAEHMAIVGKMAHDGIGDGDPGERIRAEGFRKAWGENVATGQTSPEQVVREWMASPGHRRNILDPNYQQMGVAYVTASNGRSYWAQSFGAA